MLSPDLVERIDSLCTWFWLHSITTDSDSAETIKKAGKQVLDRDLDDSEVQQIKDYRTAAVKPFITLIKK